MASGKKNYFRHYTGAYEDEKIQRAISFLGIEGYAYYFTLLEILAKQCENEFKNPIRIHRQTLKNVWRKQDKSCDKVLTKLEESGLFVVTKWTQSDYKVDTFLKSLYEIDIPNLSKYMGKYETKIDPNTPNKKKEKENKINKRKENESENPSTSETSFSIPASILETYKMLMGYSEEIITLVAKEAYPIYLADSNTGKKWDRFLSHYIKNEKANIQILIQDQIEKENMRKKYEGSEYEF